MQIKAQQRLRAASQELQDEAEKVMNWVISFMGKPKKDNMFGDSHDNEGLIVWEATTSSIKNGIGTIELYLSDTSISIDIKTKSTDKGRTDIDVSASSAASLYKAMKRDLDVFPKTLPVKFLLNSLKKVKY